MKALSLTQPWAQLVVLGQKQFETRSWTTGLRERIAIHASKTFPRYARELSASSPYYLPSLSIYAAGEFPLGAIIGTVEIAYMMATEEIERTLTAKEIAFGDYGPNRWAWSLQNPKLLAEPIPCRGHLGLWQVPDEIEERIRDAPG